MSRNTTKPPVVKVFHRNFERACFLFVQEVQASKNVFVDIQHSDTDSVSLAQNKHVKDFNFENLCVRADLVQVSCFSFFLLESFVSYLFFLETDAVATSVALCLQEDEAGIPQDAFALFLCQSGLFFNCALNVFFYDCAMKFVLLHKLLAAKDLALSRKEFLTEVHKLTPNFCDLRVMAQLCYSQATESFFSLQNFVGSKSSLCDGSTNTNRAHLLYLFLEHLVAEHFQDSKKISELSNYVLELS